MSFGIPVRNGVAIGLMPSTTLAVSAMGAAPALNWDFLTSTSLDSRITFSRSSVATRVNSSGVIETVLANTPRFDYDPVTLAPRGWLLEDQRTNLFLNSKIDGSNLATQNVTVSAQAYTISFYGAGTITLSGTHAATVAGTATYPSRRTYTFTPTAGALTCTVSGTVQFAQIEAGTFATSFIPTSATSFQRNQDIATVTGANFSSWYNQSASTIVCDFAVVGQPPTGTADIWLINDGTTSNNLRLRQGVAIAGADVTVAAGGSGQVDTSSFALTAGTPKTAAFAIASNYAQLVAAGALVGPIDNTVNVPTVNQMVLTGSSKWLRRFVYYRQRISNPTLRRLTL